MAQAKVSSFAKWLLQLEDPDTPNTFAAPCGLTSRGLSQSKNTNDVTIPDCDDEDALAYVGRAVESASATISGSGVMDRDSFETWRKFWDATDAWNVRMKLDESGANGGGYYQGAFHLTKLDVTGERGGKVQLEIELSSDGAWAWTDAV